MVDGLFGVLGFVWEGKGRALLTEGRLIFLAGFGHAIWVYRGGSGGAAAGLGVVSGGQEGVDREREPLLAQQRPEEGE